MANTEHRWGTWSVHPINAEHDREWFTSEHHALDVAMDWSVDLNGQKMIIQRDGSDWMEVTA